MMIGARIRSCREAKGLSQGQIEERTGLLRCYVSRVENGHTIPSLDTLEKISRALEMPIYQLVYEGDEPPQPALPARRRSSGNPLWGSRGKQAHLLMRLRLLLGQMEPDDRELLFFLAQSLAKHSRPSRTVLPTRKSRADRATAVPESRASS